MANLKLLDGYESVRAGLNSKTIVCHQWELFRLMQHYLHLHNRTIHVFVDRISCLRSARAVLFFYQFSAAVTSAGFV